MKIDVRPRKRNAPRPQEKSAPQFLQWLRGRPCVFASISQCEGKMEAMHLDFAGDKGMGSKVSDKYSVPSCTGHHRRQHAKGWVTFLREMELTKELMLAAAEYAWQRWPGRIAWERKVNGS